MTKLETELSNKWILNLKKQCTEAGERIKLFKIHQDAYQEPGISDWLGCYYSIFLAIEFKVDTKPKPAQEEFLTDVIECGAIGIVICFKNTKPIDYTWGQERQIIQTCIKTSRPGTFIFSY